MFDYKILKTEIMNNYLHINRILIPISLPIISLKSEYLQTKIDGYMSNIVTNNFIQLLSYYNINRDMFEMITFLENEIIYNISLADDLDPLIVIDEVGDDIINFLNILLNIVEEIYIKYDVKHTFSIVDKSFDLLLNDEGHIQSIHEITYWSETYVVLDEYIFK